MQNSKQKWDGRYQKRSTRPDPPECLVQYLDKLPMGKVLDIASGDGAAALYLAENGFEVTAVDISGVGLELLRRHSAESGRQIETQVLDLEDSNAMFDLSDKFKVIIISRYKPADFLWLKLVNLLEEGGVILFFTFNESHHLKTGFPKRFCLKKNECISLLPELELLDYQQGTFVPEMDLYLFQKR